MPLDESEKALLSEALLKCEEMEKEIDKYLKIINKCQSIIDICEGVHARNLNIVKLCGVKEGS